MLNLKKQAIKRLNNEINHLDNQLRDLAWDDPYCDKKTQSAINKNCLALEHKRKFLETVKKFIK